MRTTVTLDADVIAAMDAMRREESLGLSEARKRLARRGIAASRAPRAEYVHRSVDLGLAVDVANIGDVLDVLDAEP